MDDPAWRDGYALLARHDLSFDLQTPWWHLDAARDHAADFPAMQIILNHAGLPVDRSPDRISAGFDPAAREGMFAGNARRIYRIREA